MEINTLFNLVRLDWENAYRHPGDGTVLNREYEINPEEFLEFAENDILTNDRRGLVNALSNSKRAIDCQVDKMLECYGINAKKWNLRNFPAKLDLLKDIGVVAPRIVRKVITTRNYLEHDYKCPEKESVEDAIDVAHLFVEASNRKLTIWEHFYIVDKEYNSWNFEKNINIRFDHDEGKFRIHGNRDHKRIGESIITTANKDEYIALLKIAISTKDEINDETIQYLISLSKK